MARHSNLGFGDGLGAFFGGIGYVLGTPSIWPFAAVPAFILLLLSIGFMVFGIYSAGWLSDWIFGEDERSTLSSVGYWSLKVLFWLIAMLVAGLLGLLLAQPLSGFALDAIARRQEQALTGQPRPEPNIIASMLRALRVASVTLVVGAAALTGLFFIDLILPFLLVITIPLRFLLVAWLLAWDFADYPLGLRGLGLRARLRWFGRNFGAVTAFGSAWSLLLIVPGIVLLLLPMGVAGATRMVVRSSVD